MSKQSAGLLLFRRVDNVVEVLLGHPGGPFWAKKDNGAWSIPKGEFAEGEESLKAAYREFQEELGHEAPQGDPIDLGNAKRKDGKVIYAWALEGDFDATSIASNTFDLEWPPKSGKVQAFPEIDRAQWFSLDRAVTKIHPIQAVFLERLAERLGLEQPRPQEQMSLL